MREYADTDYRRSRSMQEVSWYKIRDNLRDGQLLP